LARCLIIGCGCRGLALAGELRARGHAVRATTRDPGRLDALGAGGCEAVLADPDRVATLAPAFEHVGVAFVLLGSAVADSSQLEALHTTRLDMLLLRMLDSTVRGIVYEASGSVDGGLLRGGADRVKAFCEDSMIPYVLINADPRDYAVWVRAAAGAVDAVLGAQTER
jgi:nucleoside-diphosphate-sugar epimerase